MDSSNKIVIALSGGVDSSVAAALLKERGREVVGISLQLWNYSSDVDNRFGTCCSLDDLADARRVAHKVGIPFYVLNLEKEFREEVVDYFTSEYLKGRTPIPCTLCNQKLKFDRLFQKAEGFGIERIATGHYAEIVQIEGRFSVRRGADLSRDQSYFLFNLSQEQLSRLEFPLADLEKSEVRRLAESIGLNVAGKSESREICFIPDNDYAGFIASEVPEAFKEGQIVNESGDVLGTHKGYPSFTIGQRKGLNIGGLKEPHFVTGISPDENKITVGLKADLYQDEFYVDSTNWQLNVNGPFKALAQIRYRHKAAPATITPLENNRAKVNFDEPQLSIAAGQSAVFYRDDCIVGGGWIE
jgi:tRNA-uridine 2-sulfurtransferase